MIREEGFTGIAGMCGVVKDGLLPGFNNYEMGQAAVGDSFQWFVERCMPAAILEEACDLGMSPYALLNEKAAALAPGENGVMALDWWNGTRSGLNDQNLSGLLLGLTLQTKPEEIYRAIVESTAYGARKMIRMFEDASLDIRALYATGGISRKSPFIMQTYADIIGKPIYVADSTESAAHGAAIYGAVVADFEKTGIKDIFDAVKKLGALMPEHYEPNAEYKTAYDRMYGYYERLYELFGKTHPDIMRELKAARGAP
jgi:L-ribulokinase